ncbi:Uncharacterised protein [Photobacterium damselae]|uniref:Uncharacterized protein n=1 Tax=Photobacterium damselae TaxID=38293 RepID=A0A2X1XMQ8_PHODM|nr:Uncharacterised protein [Photobacterium damselae]
MQKIPIKYAQFSHSYPVLHVLTLILLLAAIITISITCLYFHNLQAWLYFIPCLALILFFKQASSYKAQYLSHQN